MNEKCPCCGSEMSETYLGWVCMNMSLENPCSFRIAKERLPRIAAAMELARAEGALAVTVREIDDPSVIGEAMSAVCAARDKVVEVFGGE